MWVHTRQSTKSTVQELTKTRSVSGIVTGLAVALSTDSTPKLFRIRVISASGHPARCEYIISHRILHFRILLGCWSAL